MSNTPSVSVLVLVIWYMLTLVICSLNNKVNLIPYPVPVTPSTALDLLRPYSIILDCTDRPLTRYLLSDAAVRLDVPLVSGAAISSAGQWAVYGGKTKSGKRRACYRCIWPSILPGSVGTCEEQGVWGVVTGMIGVGMAGEAIKLIVGKEGELGYSVRQDNKLIAISADPEPLLHLHHLGSNPLIRTIRIKPPSAKCITCGPDATITDDLDVFGYESFCAGGAETNDETGLVTGQSGHRISVQVSVAYKDLDLANWYTTRNLMTCCSLTSPK